MNSTEELRSLEKRFRTVNMFLCIVFCSIIWCIGAITVICCGPCSVAIYKTLREQMECGDDAFVHNFFSYFKKFFKSGLVIWIAILLLAAVILYCFAFANYMMEQASFWNLLRYVYLALLMLLGIITSFIFPCLAHFKGPIFAQYKISIIYTFKHIFTALTCALVLFIAVFICYKFPPALVVTPALASLLNSTVIEKLFIDENLISKEED